MPPLHQPAGGREILRPSVQEHALPLPVSRTRLPSPLACHQHTPSLRLNPRPGTEGRGAYGPHQDLHCRRRPCLNWQARVGLIPVGPSVMLFSELLPLLLGDRLVPRLGWARLGPHRGHSVCASYLYLRQDHAIVRTGMRPRTCTRVTGMSRGIMMKSIMDRSWACAPAPLHVHVHPVG